MCTPGKFPFELLAGDGGSAVAAGTADAAIVGAAEGAGLASTGTAALSTAGMAAFAAEPASCKRSLVSVSARTADAAIVGAPECAGSASTEIAALGPPGLAGFAAEQCEAATCKRSLAGAARERVPMTGTILCASDMHGLLATPTHETISCK